MCRIEDDFEWRVEEFADVLAGADTDCPDCGRMMGAGEPIVRMTVVDDVEPDYCAHAVAGTTRIDLTWRDEMWDAFEALGFKIEEGEVELPSRAEWWCPQCRAANRWLVEICDQSTVQVARADLDEHAADYDEATLGPAFMALHRASRRWWRGLDGRLIPVEIVESWASHAIDWFRRSGRVA